MVKLYLHVSLWITGLFDFGGLPLFLACILAGSSCLGQDEGSQNRREKAFVEQINDSTRVEVYLQYNERGLPDFYFAHVKTAVCEHGLCRLLVIDVFWDLLGNFLKYELPPGESLTKLDHLEFSKEDHEQLYSILADRGSILRDYPVEDLIVHRPPVKSRKDVDAVSAATRVEVKDAVVSGAVYSTYTLWHIVNGPISSRIEEFSRPMLTEEMVMRMLYSGNFYYQFFALNYKPVRDPAKFADGVVHLIRNGISYIPYFAIEALPQTCWENEKYQICLLEHFSGADFELQNAMLAKITDIKLCTQALDFLVLGLKDITENQMIKVFEVIRYSQDRLSEKSLKAISQLVRHPNSQVSECSKLLLKYREYKRRKRP